MQRLDTVSLYLLSFLVLMLGLAHGLILLPVLLSLVGPQGQLFVTHAVVQQPSPHGKTRRTFLEI
jgi:hypothetical protein